MKTTKIKIGNETWEPTQEQIDALVAAYEAEQKASNLYPPTATDREHRMADAMDASLNEVRAVLKEEGAQKATDFMHRYREKAKETIAHAALHEFFELAAKLNESAFALGIRHLDLDADNGDVTVTYRSGIRVIPIKVQDEGSGINLSP